MVLEGSGTEHQLCKRHEFYKEAGFLGATNLVIASTLNSRSFAGDGEPTPYICRSYKHDVLQEYCVSKQNEPHASVFTYVYFAIVHGSLKPKGWRSGRMSSALSWLQRLAPQLLQFKIFRCVSREWGGGRVFRFVCRGPCVLVYGVQDLELTVSAFPSVRFGQDTNDWYKNWDAAAGRLFVGDSKIQARCVAGLVPFHVNVLT